MKKLITILLFIFFGIVSYSFAEENFPFVAEVISDSLNIRAGYNINFEVIYKLKNKDKIVILEKKFNWYRVELPEAANCFVSSKYINKPADSQAAVVAADRVNVRARPDLNANVLCQLAKNDAVSVIEKNSQDWYKIKAPKNCYGWVRDRYVKYYSSLEQYNKENQKESVNPTEVPIEASQKPADKIEPLISQSQQQTKFEGIGVIKKAGYFFKQPGTHKLLQDGKIACFLKGDKAKLDSFLGLEARVRGNLEKDSRSKYPVVIVEDILTIE